MVRSLTFHFVCFEHWVDTDKRNRLTTKLTFSVNCCQCTSECIVLTLHFRCSDFPFVRCFPIFDHFAWTAFVLMFFFCFFFFVSTKAFTDTAYCVGVYSLFISIHDSRAYHNRLEITGMANARDHHTGCSSHINSVVNEPSMGNVVRACCCSGSPTETPTTKYFYVAFTCFSDSLLLHWHRTGILFGFFSLARIPSLHSYVGCDKLRCDVIRKHIFFSFSHLLVRLRYFSSQFTAAADTFFCFSSFFFSVQMIRTCVRRTHCRMLFWQTCEWHELWKWISFDYFIFSFNSFVEDGIFLGGCPLCVCGANAIIRFMPTLMNRRMRYGNIMCWIASAMMCR